MTIRVALRHQTEYRFDRHVALSPHEVRLRPAVHSRTPIVGYSLRVTPQPHFLNWQQDPFGNHIARLLFPEKVDRLGIDVEVIADLTVINPFDFFLAEQAERIPFDYTDQQRRELAPYLEVREHGERLRAWLAAVDTTQPVPTIDFLVALNQRLQRDIDYRIRMEPGVQSCEETLATSSGSCRDSAWLLVQILRQLGLAARFASGYLVQLTPDVESLDGPSGTDHDFTDLHAWCEVYLPGAGWAGLDPTSGLFAGEGHIPLACTPDPVSAAPITGATDPCEVEFSFANQVTRIHEDPRVTKPYDDAQWAAALALGAAVDRDLERYDARLTMGGEPTFVSIDDMESAQWNTAALGADKLSRAKELLTRLRDRFAPGGLLHYGQGKWYPGEELPRWALGCFWRLDGEPVWRHPEQLARVDRNYGADFEVAQRFGERLVGALGVPPQHLRPAYEDPVHYVMLEQQLPADIDPRQFDLDSDLERQRLARLLQRGLGEPTGLVLPLARDDGEPGWQSSAWKLRRGELFLIPGDSPLGMRLPLDALPWDDGSGELPQFSPDPFAPRTALPSAAELAGQATVPSPPAEPSRRPAGRPPLVRTALCIEPRDGRLHLFLPPLDRLEAYLELVAAIESCSLETAMPVVIEGYEPPRDPRLLRLLVTPDPGVIEVNIHPASNWGELVANTVALYEEAHQARLATEKFMLDGRHTGTGGGNHVTIGAATPADSPLLRRPDLLRSLVTYWQHHPGLSYLFSGMFVGPTSQAPRVDEGRDEGLYELEIALQQIPDGDVDRPWLVDRLMRNLLVDITGNTHRAEFCIDKLYSPSGPGGRQGLLEFRGFEMPPHARMSLVQMLLLRTLIARFLADPYRGPLVRWGTALHDRFLLPHFVWRDVHDVVVDLRQHGYPFQPDWLAPFLEFRFPTYGEVQVDDLRLQLRMAIEPWHVLGEEIGSFGTARYVDSSLERLQLKVEGLTPGRHVLACNGRRVPLVATVTHGEFVAGIRYRAWQPPSALHPTIGVHAPLVFDVVDSWNGRSIGGCTYHVVHPGGRSYEAFPVNAFEAESRRVNRFWGYGHSPGRIELPAEYHALREFFPAGHPPGPMAPPAEERNAEYPATLDLRRDPAI